VPPVLSVEEVMLLLQGSAQAEVRGGTRHAYGAGLHVPEVVALKVDDADFERPSPGLSL